MSTPAESVNKGGAPLGSANFKSGRVYRENLRKKLRTEVLDAIQDKAIEQATAGDAKAREHVAQYADEPDPAAAVNVQVNVLVPPPDIFAGLTRDELAVIRQALPILRRVGLLGGSGGGGADGGGAEPA